MPKKLTNDEFLAKARVKHGDRYEYLDPYTNVRTPIRVRCKKHNYIFTPKPLNHIYGNVTGCPICASESRKGKLRTSQSEIITLAKQTHGDGRYDYSEVGNFPNTATKVNIICHRKDSNGNEHGVFCQTFKNHIYFRQGCPKCAGVSRLTTETFVAKSKKIHGANKFDYSNVLYKNNRTKVRLKCNVCGYVFLQIPSNHLQGEGCPKCAKTQIANKIRMSKEDFILKARQVHGWKYDYSKVEYKGNKTKVCIICPKHGEFWQIPNSHLLEKGCRKCAGDSLKRLIGGVGINDLHWKDVDAQIYSIWSGIIKRCYDKKSQKKNPTYIGCSVCDEWFLFSNFQKWYRENCINGYAIDKDILVKGNRIYSPDTCCAVPLRINNLILKAQKERGELPIGVRKMKNGRYYTRVSKQENNIIHNTTIGYFDTPEEAFYAYKKAKEEYIKEVAQEYYDRGEITKKVYDALMEYEVEITD